MFNWNDKYEWIFSDLGAGDKVGVNEAGIGMFKKQSYFALTKEVLQNVIDAKDPTLPEDVPAKAKFELIYVDIDDIPGYERLIDVINKCYDYCEDGDDKAKIKVFKDAAEKYLTDSGKVPVLKISDYNTRGAQGVREKKGSDWTGLVRERSATNKSNNSNGSFGVGKFAPYNFTSIRTVLYTTKTYKGEFAFQGKAILTSFSEDGEDKQNIGLFADKSNKNFDAVFDINDIPPVFRREENGTDIFVLCFEKDDNWVEQVAVSVIEHFFYSIYKGKLEVEIKDGEKEECITKDNLDNKINFYKQYYLDHLEDDPDFTFTAPSYWKILKDPIHRVPIVDTFKFNGKSMGNYELYLLTGDGIEEKRVLEMRQAGMKIREDTSFRIPMNFIGIFVATGEGAVSNEPEDNISSFLRKCENPAHNDWSANEYQEEKNNAKGIINKIHSIIFNAVKAEMPDLSDKAIDAFGLSEFLANEEADDDQREEAAFSDFRPLDIVIQPVKESKKQNRQKDISMPQNGVSKHSTKNKHKPENKDDKDKKRGGNKHPNNRHSKGIDKGREISISRIKTPFIESLGAYKISFIADESVTDLNIEIRIGSDDENLSKAVVTDASLDGKQLFIKDNIIQIGNVSSGEQKTVIIQLNDKNRKTMEVRAYAER